MSSLIPILPPPVLINGLNHIPGPSPAVFDSKFGGFLPQGTSIASSWGSTRYYDFSTSSQAINSSQRKIILIHGGGTPAVGLAPLAHAITAAGDNHVVAYDSWGHGCSSTPLAPHTPALYHTQLLELLAHLKWTNVHLLGFSIGGAIAVSFAAIHRGVVDSLAMVAAPGLLRKEDRPWMRAMMEDGGWGREWLSRRRILSMIGADQLPNKDWEERWERGQMDTNAVEKWQRDNHRGHIASLASSFRYGGVYDLKDEYKRVAESTLRTLVVLGAEDGFILPDFTRRELLGLGWRGEVVLVEGAGHAIVRTNVQEVTEFVVRFWDNLA